MVKKVAIINAPDNVNFESDTGVCPPLGCLRVALAATKSGADVKFIDGQHHTSLDDVLKHVEIDTDIVGISFNRVTIPTVKPLIESLLEKGVKQIVTGGQAVMPIAEYFVSYFANPRVMACYGDGEPAIIFLINENPLRDVPNIIYYNGSKNVKNNPEIFIDYNSLGVLDYSQISGFEWQNYFRVSKKVFEEDKKRASAYFADGCPRRIKKGCSFCARRKTGFIRRVTPNAAYDQLIHLKEQGADSVNIESDTFFSDTVFLQELCSIVKSKGSPHLKLHVYGGVTELSQKNLDYAEYLGVKSILVGVESGNKIIRRINGKYFNDDKVFKTAVECNKRGISYNPAFVFGMIGETDKTAMQTVHLAEKLVEKGYSDKVYASLFMPFPDCPAYDLIKGRLRLNQELYCKYGDQFNRWNYDWSILIDAQIDILTTTSRKKLIHCIDRLKNLNNSVKPVIGNYSVKKS